MGEVRDDLRQVVDRLVTGVVLDVRGVVVDPDGVAADLLHQRDRHVARGHNVAVDLEGDDDASALGGVREFADVAEERRLVLVRALVAADGGVHDREPVVGRPAHRLDPVLEPLAGRQIGVPAEADGLEPVVLERAADVGGRRVEVDVLRPAWHRRELDEAVAGAGDPRERLL